MARWNFANETRTTAAERTHGMSNFVRILRTFVLLVMVGVAFSLPHPDALASDKRCKRGQDCALGEREKGTIRPLPEVLAAARAAVPGEVVKIELEREDGIWVYEIKILTPSGRRRTVEVNAETLAIIKID